MECGTVDGAGLVILARYIVWMRQRAESAFLHWLTGGHGRGLRA